MAIGQIPAGFACNPSGLITDRSKAGVIPLPTLGDSRWPYSMVDLSFACDFTDALTTPIRLRVAVHNTAGGWRIQMVDIKSTDARAHVWLQSGDDKASVCRVPLTATDTASDVPCSWLVETRLQA